MGEGPKPHQHTGNHLGNSVVGKRSQRLQLTRRVAYPSLNAPVKSGDALTGISRKAKLAQPVVRILEASYPPAAPAIEIGYQIVSNLDTVREVYRIAASPSPFEKKLSGFTKLAASKIARNLASQAVHLPIDQVNDLAVQSMANELKKKHVFDELAKTLEQYGIGSALLQELFTDAMRKLMEKNEEELWRSYRK